MSAAAGEYRPGPPGQGRRGPVILASTVVVSGLILVAIAVAVGSSFRLAAAPLALLVLVAAAHEKLLAWRSLLGLTMIVILVVPIRRYTLPAGLPFHLELYRLVVAGVFVAWLTSLLIDRRVRLRSSPMDAPLAAFLVAILLSILVNTHRVAAVGNDFTKTITFFLSFFAVFYVIVSLAQRPRDIDFLVRILAGGGALLGVTALVESRTGYNVFNHLRGFLPFLDYDANYTPPIDRGGRLRVYASAQHPISLGAAFAVLLPLAIYRARAFHQRRWWLAAILIGFGLFAAQSRTAILMLLAIGIVYLVLYPKDMKRLWPLALPALVILHFVLPGTIGTLKASFFPKGGLIAEQSDAKVGSGRISTLGPALRTEFLPNPILGEGFGTRITQPDESGSVPNAPITDDEWLSLLLETGVVGALAFLWIFVRAIRRMGGAARGDRTARGWLLTSMTASVAAYGVGMFTYDSFSFIQVTFLFFIVLALGTAALLTSTDDWERFMRKQQVSREG